MSYKVIRQLLETRLAQMPGGLTTAWENAQLDESQGGPYQRVYLLPGQTEQPTMGSLTGSGTALQREVGLLQVSLYYPQNAGPGDAAAMAETLRARFPRGLVLTSGSVRVVIEQAPSIGPSLTEGGFYVLPVSVFYRADVLS